MITLNSDFMNYSDNPVGMENINTEDIFHIDVNSRQIIVPDSWTAVGALQDHLAEKIWFAIDRFFDDRDFATATRFSINFLNAASEGYIHNSTEVYKWDEVNNVVIPVDDTEHDDPMVYNKLLFRWRISQNVTVKTGKVIFAVRIGKYETLNDDSVEATLEQDETTWMWNTTIASLAVLESVAVEAGADSEGNEWGVNDMARWFYAISNAQISLNEFIGMYTAMDHVVAGPKGNFTWSQFKYIGDTIEEQPMSTPEPPFEIQNDVMTVTPNGYTELTTATWRNNMWINTDTSTRTTVTIPEVNDTATNLIDTWSSSKISAENNNIKDYINSKIYSTTAGSGTTGAWAVNPTTAYIQAQFGTSSATAATSGMSAQGIRQYADSKITNTASDTSTSVGLSASAVKSYMSTNYLTTAAAASNYLAASAIDDTTTASNKLWSSHKVKDYVDSKDSLPSVTSADAGKVLMVDANGDWVVGTISGGGIPQVVASITTMGGIE